MIRDSFREMFLLNGKNHQYYFIGMEPLKTWPQRFRDEYPFGFYIRSSPGTTKS